MFRICPSFSTFRHHKNLVTDLHSSQVNLRKVAHSDVALAELTVRFPAGSSSSYITRHLGEALVEFEETIGKPSFITDPVVSTTANVILRAENYDDGEVFKSYSVFYGQNFGPEEKSAGDKFSITDPVIVRDGDASKVQTAFAPGEIESKFSACILESSAVVVEEVLNVIYIVRALVPRRKRKSTLGSASSRRLLQTTRRRRL